MKISHIAIAAALSLASAGMAAAETLKVSTFLPPKHTWNKAIAAWGEELKEKSGGKLEVEIFPAGQLGPPPRQFDLVRSGGADLAVILHSATPGRFATTELAGLPLTTPSAGNTSAAMSRRLTELAPEYLAAEHGGTKIMWMAVTPPLKIHLTKADPSDLSNLEGLRIRYAGAVWQKVIEALGASPVPVPPAEASDAMGKGVVDGASFPFEAAMAFDLAPVSDYSLEPGLASATFALVMNQATYDGLSPDLQKIIDETTGPDRAEWYGARWDASEARGRKYMEDAGINIVTLTADQQAGLAEKFGDIVQAKTDGVKGGAGFVEAYTK